MSSNNSIVSFVDSQLPAFIREDNPKFGAFLKAYYEWLETSTTEDANGNGTLYHTKKLPDYNDIDRTTDEFLEYFKRDLLPYFPKEIALDERKLIKQAREFYAKNGTIESIQFLFRVLYDKEVDIFYPKEQILRASDGKWNLPQAFRLIVSAQNSSFNIELIEKKQAIGSISKARCIIESANKVVDRTLNREIFEVYVSNVNKLFRNGENLTVVYDYDALGNPLTFSAKIIGSLSNIKVDSKNQGLRYRGLERDSFGNIIYQGDPVVLIGGLANTAEAIEAVAYVANVSSGQIKSVTVIDGGYGFRVDPNTKIAVISAPGDIGTGANLIVQSVDTTQLVYRSIDTDSIKYKENVQLGAANYGFANIAVSNVNTTFANAFSFANIAFAPLKTILVVNGGAGFKTVPSLSFDVRYDSDYSNDQLLSLPANYTATVQHIRDLGAIAAVKIISGGSGYNPATDAIYFNSQTGDGAGATFTVDGAGRITSITMATEGSGYFTIPTPLVANSANIQNAASGTGAVLVAYGYGEGQSTSLSVDDIGRVQSIRLANRGFDYERTPNVSLRVQDIKILPLASNQFLYESDILYQGQDSSNATFLAYVESYDRSNSVLRIYDYRGTLNANSSITGPSFSVTVNYAAANNIITYGNGKAKATAEFLNGLIKYDGFWSRTDGFLSSDQFLQDSERYHNFSYEIAVEKALSEYRDTLKNILHPTGTSMLGLYRVVDDRTVGTSDDLNVDKIAGLTGSVTANLVRPNLFSAGESFDTYPTNGIWFRNYSIIYVNSTIAPDGTFSADHWVRINNNAAALVHRIFQGITSQVGKVYTYSIYVKKHPKFTQDWVMMRISTNTPVTTKDTWFNVANGQIGTIATGLRAYSQDVGSGWYRIGVSCEAFASGAGGVTFSLYGVTTNGSSFGYSGDPRYGIYLWGAQAEEGWNMGKYMKSNPKLTSGSGTRTYFAANGRMLTVSGSVQRNSYAYDVSTGTWVPEGPLIEPAARTNLLTYSEDLNNWTKVNSNVASVGVALDGNTSANLITANATSGVHEIYSSFSGAANTTYTFSVFLKPQNYSWANLFFRGTGFNNITTSGYFDLANGEIGGISVANVAGFNMKAYGGGWYRCSVTAQANDTTGLYYAGVSLSTGNNIVTYTGDGASGLYIWGGQVEIANGISTSGNVGETSYIKTTGSTVTRAAEGLTIASMYTADYENKIVIGSGTDFGNTAKANDILVINPGSAREQSRMIANVYKGNTLESFANTYVLELESSFTYVSDARLTLINNSNVVISTDATVPYVANDILSYGNANGNVAFVVSVTGNAITTNVNSGINATGVVFSVSPVINNVSYKIITV